LLLKKVGILILVITVFCTGFVSSQSKLRKLVKDELEKGIILDTAYMNFCFSDSSESFNLKLLSFKNSNQLRIDTLGKSIRYFFPTDSLFSNFSIILKPVFLNRSLAELDFACFPNRKNISENRFATINQMRKSLEQKYGAFSLADTTSMLAGKPVSRFYWIHGNRKIYLVGQRFENGLPDFIEITFSDTRNQKKN
jgi:hypothetical protein